MKHTQIIGNWQRENVQSDGEKTQEKHRELKIIHPVHHLGSQIQHLSQPA